MKTKAEIQQYIHRYEVRRKKYRKCLSNNSKVLHNLKRELKSYEKREKMFKNLTSQFNTYWGEDVKHSQDRITIEIFCYFCSQFTGMAQMGRNYMKYSEYKWDYRLKCGKILSKTTKKDQCKELMQHIKI